LSSFFERYWFILFVLLLAVLSGVAWGNYRFVEANPGGNDFLVHWEGTRSLLVDGLSPYSDEVALRIQKLAYGRPARPGEHELRVAYPLYAEAFFLPFAFISDFNVARAAWMTVLEGCLVALAFFSLRLTEWKPGILILTAFLIFSIFWYHGLRIGRFKTSPRSFATRLITLLELPVQFFRPGSRLRAASWGGG
jgi:hypothetical protein